ATPWIRPPCRICLASCGETSTFLISASWRATTRPTPASCRPWPRPSRPCTEHGPGRARYDVRMSKVIYHADQSAQGAGLLPQAPLPAAGQPARDTRARPMRDLRISVTDRCNFRCTYCMPREVFDGNYAFMPQSALLSFEEITRLARLFAQLGVEK